MSFVRRRALLTSQPMIPRVPTLAEDKGQAPPPTDPTPPDPGKGEKDVPVDDLGDDADREAA